MKRIIIIASLLLLGSCTSKEIDTDNLYGVWNLTALTTIGWDETYYLNYIEEYEYRWEIKANGVIIMTANSGVYTGTWEFSDQGKSYLEESEGYSGEPILINCYFYKDETV